MNKDDKEFIPGEDNQPDTEALNPAAEEEETNKLKYEENDNWVFDAQAPTLDNNILENDEFEINIPAEKPAPAPAAPAYKPAEPNQITVKTDTIKFACTAVIIAIVIAILAVLGVRYYTMPNSDEKMNPGNVALTVGDTPVSIGMYNYYYTCISNNYISYASYGQYDLDTTKDFSKQKTTDEDGNTVTWAQLFVNSTIDQIQYITSYYEEAEKAGVTLTKEQKTTINENLDSIKESASQSDLSVDEYISSTYGEYCGYATLKKMLEQCYIAENYYQQKQVEDKVSDKDAKAYYSKHKEEFMCVPMAYLQLSYDSSDEKEKEKTVKQANELAAKIKDRDSLKKLIPQVYKDTVQQYLDAGYFGSEKECIAFFAESSEADVTKDSESFSEDIVKWLYNDSVKKNTCKTFVDDESGIVYIVLKLDGPTLMDDEVYSVRHILIMPGSDEKEEEEASDIDVESEEEEKDVEYTDDQWKKAEEKANEVYDEFKKGDKTEYSFAKLAEEYSEDTASTSAGSNGSVYGGLCQGTEIGKMVEPFESWSIDKSRKYGDTDIIKSEFGYHIMYFIEDTQYYINQCKLVLAKENEDKFVDSHSVKKHSSAMSKTKVAEPTAATESDNSQTFTNENAE